MKNTKGLSTIVTTLILVLLVLVAVGILWGPVKNLLNKNTAAFDKTKCLTLDFRANVNAENADTGEYTVVIERRDTGDEPVNVRYILQNATQSGSSHDFNTAFSALDKRSDDIVAADNEVINATSLQIIPYYIDEVSGKEQACAPIEYEINGQ